MSILEKIGLKRAPASTEKSAGGKIVKVGPGDTLKKIAAREYGDESQWERIYQANKWKIDDPEMVYPGMDLRLP